MRCVCLIGGLLLAGIALATEPRLASVQPTGGQRGNEIEVRLGGERLEDAEEIVFYHPGLSVVNMEASTNRVKATLKIAADCPLGEHTLRLRTASGVSEVRTFWVGALPQVAEVEPNNEPARAQRVLLNVTLTGTVPNEDVDYFVVAARKGDRLTAEIEGMRLGRGLFDSFVSITGSNGQLLIASDDTCLALQDGIASVIAPADGDYTFQVRETSFGGKDNYHYRLHLGTFPRPTVVFPSAGRAGETVTLRFLGDVLGDTEEKVQLPSRPLEKFGVFPSGSLPPSPNWMRVTPYPCVGETEPNDRWDEAMAARKVPVIFNGILSQQGDHDWFRIHGRKGQAFTVSVFARRLRSPVDSVIQIVNSKGAPMAENDDSEGPDSSLTFKPEEDGEYSVLIRDHLERGGSNYVYAVEVAPAEPRLSIKIPDVARNDTQSRQYIAVPRGNRVATRISAKRLNLSGSLQFEVEDLPPGVRLVADRLEGTLDQAALVFEASLEAKVGGRLVDLVARATNGVAAAYQNDIELVQGPNNTSYYGTRVDKLLVAVIDPAPFQIRLIEPKVPLVQGGSMELKVEVTRDPGFAEPIVLRMVWNPPGVTSLPEVTLAKGETNAVYTLNAKRDADLRSWRIVLHGSAAVNGGDLFVSSGLTPISIEEPFLSGKIETVACSPGESTNITVKLEPKTPFEGKATIKLMGLSEKVSVPTKEITAEDREVVFPVTVNSKCPTGSQKNLFCAVSIQREGETIPHSIAAGGTFRVVPPKSPAASGPKKLVRNSP